MGDKGWHLAVCARALHDSTELQPGPQTQAPEVASFRDGRAAVLLRMGHLPSAIFHRPSSISHLPSAIFHRPSFDAKRQGWREQHHQSAGSMTTHLKRHSYQLTHLHSSLVELRGNIWQAGGPLRWPSPTCASDMMNQSMSRRRSCPMRRPSH